MPDSWEFDDNRDFFFGGVYVGRAPLLGKPSMNPAPSIGKGVFWFEHEFPAVYVGEFGPFNGNLMDMGSSGLPTERMILNSIWKPKAISTKS